MNDRQRTQLAKYVVDAQNIERGLDIRPWSSRVAEFLDQALGPDMAVRFRGLNVADTFAELALQLGHIEGLIAKDEDASDPHTSGLAEQGKAMVAPSTVTTRRVFVVHGHDGEVKETVARFLEKLGLEPVILHEQPNQGRTIIEKFEVSSSDVAFAVVLLTPDDLGGAATSPNGLHPRARQNVILELGLFPRKARSNARLCPP